MKIILPLILMTLIAAPPAAIAAPGDQADLSASRGKALWEQTQTISGQPRSCTTCHTADPRQPGKHARTGKLIKPMAPSVNIDRLTDQSKIEKWFKRNCKWTLGRVCTSQEKGDVLEYLKSL
jgi:Domain of unknown function (DUF1924)